MVKAVNRLDTHHGSNSGLMGKNKKRNKWNYASPPGADGYRLVGGRPASSGPKHGGNGGGGNGGNGGSGNGGSGGGGNNLAKQLQQFLQQHLHGSGGRPANKGTNPGVWKPRWTKAEWDEWNAKQEEEKAKRDSEKAKPASDDEADANTRSIRADVQDLHKAKIVIHKPGAFNPEVVQAFDKNHDSESQVNNVMKMREKIWVIVNEIHSSFGKNCLIY